MQSPSFTFRLHIRCYRHVCLFFVSWKLNVCCCEGKPSNSLPIKTNNRKFENLTERKMDLPTAIFHISNRAMCCAGLRKMWLLHRKRYNRKNDCVICSIIFPLHIFVCVLGMDLRKHIYFELKFSGKLVAYWRPNMLLSFQIQIH